jgi:VanZ family protein
MASVRTLILDAANSLWIKVAGGTCVVAIIVFSLIPQVERVSTGLPGKYEHFLAYSVTGLILGLAIQGKKGLILAGGFLIGLASLLEVLQLWSPGRHPRVSDAIVGAASGILGAAIAAWLRRKLSEPSPSGDQQSVRRKS